MRVDGISSSLELAPYILAKNWYKPSSAILRGFLLFILFSTVSHPPLPSPTVPCQNMSPVVGLVILLNARCPETWRTRTDGILSSCPVIDLGCVTSRYERQGRTTFYHLVSFRGLQASGNPAYNLWWVIGSVYGLMRVHEVMSTLVSVKSLYPCSFSTMPTIMSPIHTNTSIDRFN